MKKAYVKVTKAELVFVGGVVIAMILVQASWAFAGGGGEAFTAVWTDMTDWTQGALGKVISGAMILVGAVMGVARQSITTFAVGIGCGVGLNNTPEVINSVFTATLADIAQPGLITVASALPM